MKVFSENLADAIGGNSPQVRKDFSIFGITGAKRGGYRLDELVDKLDNILGKDKVHEVVVVGAGHIGRALIDYLGFDKYGIRIVAAFDADPEKFNLNMQVPVYPVEELGEFVKEKGIKIGVISVPDSAAQRVCDTLVQSEVLGILNFAPICVSVPESCIVTNVNLALELETLIYFVKALQRQKEGVA